VFSSRQACDYERQMKLYGVGNCFSERSLPEAILKFRQGVGRLIRTKTDQGIIVALDNRILTKQYGQAFIAALPKCPLEVV
jgi:ATP-dependent DNA helicase DinG